MGSPLVKFCDSTLSPKVCSKVRRLAKIWSTALASDSTRAICSAAMEARRLFFTSCSASVAMAKVAAKTTAATPRLTRVCNPMLRDFFFKIPGESMDVEGAAAEVELAA